jgi:hypothetical protein
MFDGKGASFGKKNRSTVARELSLANFFAFNFCADHSFRELTGRFIPIWKNLVAF